MQTVRKYLAHTNYAKIENSIPRISKKYLSDGSCRLYVFLATMMTGQSISDGYLMDCLEISQRSLTKYKKELKALDLIKIKKVSRAHYYIYIGSCILGASKVEIYWEDLGGVEGSPLTKKELDKFREDK